MLNTKTGTLGTKQGRSKSRIVPNKTPLNQGLRGDWDARDADSPHPRLHVRAWHVITKVAPFASLRPKLVKATTQHRHAGDGRKAANQATFLLPEVNP